MIISQISELPDLFERLDTQGALSHAYILEGVLPATQESVLTYLVEHISDSPADVHTCEFKADKGITIDEIRDISYRLSRKPIAKRHWVFLHHAEYMNESAVNALLKVLEEPPGVACFVLIAQRAARLLPTIQSRTQRICLKQAEDLSVADPLLKQLYQMNPAELSLPESKRVLTHLYHLYKEGCLPEGVALDDSRAQLNAFMQLCCVLAKQGNKDANLWTYYDHALQLSKIQAKKSILNTQAIADRVQYWVLRLKSAA